jgi:hypothetical protein
MFAKHLLCDPLPRGGVFVCRVSPITLAGSKPGAVRGVPISPAFRPVFILKDGSIRSDGERMDFWGDDLTLPRVDSASELPGGPEWWLAASAAITRTATPRVRVLGCSDAVVERPRWNKDAELVAKPAGVYFHREDLAPWFKGGLPRDCLRAPADGHLFSLAAQGKVEVYTVAAGEKGGWWCNYAAVPPGLHGAEWAQLGQHSMAPGEPVCSGTVPLAAAVVGTPLRLPATYLAIAENGFALVDGWHGGALAVGGRLCVPSFVLVTPVKAAAFLGRPEFAGLPAGTTLVLRDLQYSWCRAVKTADLPRIVFNGQPKHPVGYDSARGLIELPDAPMDLKDDAPIPFGHRDCGFLVNAQGLKRFVASELVGRKFVIPASVARHKLQLLKDGVPTDLPGTYLREEETHGLAGAAQTRRDRKARRQELLKRVEAAVGTVPPGFDPDRHTVEDAREHARLQQAVQAGEIEPATSAIQRLCQIVPLNESAAGEVIKAQLPLRRDPVDGTLYLASPLDADTFAEEYAGDVIAAISPRLPGFLVKIMYSEVARNSVALRGLGGT